MSKSASLLDKMTPEDLAKVNEREKQRETARSNMITREWMSISELGFYYGWDAIQAVFDDVITISQMHMLIEGARKVHSGHVFDQAVATLAATSSKKGTFDSLMKRYIKDMKVTT